MNGSGGCCIARYGGYGGDGGLYGLSKADRIMLRFRPIAPKPASDGRSGSGSPVAANNGSTTTSGGSSDVSAKSERGRKRKKYPTDQCSGGSSQKCRRRKRSRVPGGRDNTSTAAVTLSLLPETPNDNKRVFPDLNVSPVEKQEKRSGPLWLSFSGGGGGEMLTTYNTAEISKKTVVITSCVEVERVTDAWIDGYGLGKSDKEKKMNLMRDTCPGFISDGVGRVTWTNEAYKKMAKSDINIPMEEGSPENIRFHLNVRLVMKERPMLAYSAFTCRVRLQYTCQHRERRSVTVPCDVWRMDGGGFAWRLDVKAALCL